MQRTRELLISTKIQRVLFAFALGASLLLPLNIAKADTANPPKVLGIKLIDPKTTSNVGDVLAFDVEYSGGDPGPAGLLVNFSTSAPQCLNGFNYARWNAKTPEFEHYTNSVLGPYSPGKIRVYATVTSSCLNGINNFYVYGAELGDKSGLVFKDAMQSGVFSFSLNVVGGLYIPVGTVIENPRKTIFSLDFLSDSYLVDETSPTIIRLPVTTPEGIYISYNASSRQSGVCKQVRSFPLAHVDVMLVGPGECEVTAGFNTRSEFSSFFFKKTINLISKAAADKAAADKAAADKAAADKAAADKAAADKAAADKAAADKAAADKAAADKAAALAKRTTITCVKGKVSKKVTAVKPKCPSGFKIKK